jgi:3-hydroxyacyl-CoA dehydrogenase/enoyl-CoA hydratase/3-hydroxybutyryl-CoA epimerase/3-hydroxyacyl-CoA dehydrogenase/enoyl-CoA hydratase/3-hydroxybutyryl-CoA epimerase/enoyl-CoA isomerase
MKASELTRIPGWKEYHMSAGAALRLDFAKSGIARITYDQPDSRANTLNQSVQTEFESILTQLESGAAGSNLQGLVLCSAKPGMFIAGADLKELASVMSQGSGLRRQEEGKGFDARAVTLRGLNFIARFEKLPCPTVALIDGACMGGGTELALAFDYRLAGSNPKTEIGLPETKIGIIPGWGGTQRLPRLIGPSLAAELICSGEAVKAARARELGIVWDAVPSEKLLEESLRLLAWSRESGEWKKIRVKKQQPVGLSEEQHQFTFAVAKAQVLAKTKGQFPAPLAALEAIAKGCNLPLEEGLKVETDHFLPLVGSTISRNLIAIFFMTGRLAKDPGVADASVQPRSVTRVGVVGAGIMGAGIVGAHLRRGIQTVMIDVSADALEKGVANITKVMQARIEIGRATQADLLSVLALLNSTQNVTQLADREVVIEAVVENEEVKTKLYRDLQKIVPADAILASNTSTISITRMAGAVAKPENFAGLHFFNPVDRMQLVEVIRGEKTSDATVVTLVALAKRLGKTPIVVKDCPGFLVNRILFPYLNEAMVLLEEGADPRALDKAATDFGMPMGPITLSDLVGLDTALYAGSVVNRAFADRAKDNKILAALVGAGRLGQKSGAGFYSYAKGSRGIDDPVFTAILEKCRTLKRTIGSVEIRDRLFLPMLIEASRVLIEGIVRDPADVDMGLILGIGFPPQRGGLLRWADTEGLGNLLQRLNKYESLGKRFQPTAQMRELAASRSGFFTA